jgi:hypothetical protein
MLDSHPDLAIPPESHFLAALIREPLTPKEFLSFLENHERFIAWGLPIEDVRRAFHDDGVSDKTSAVRALYASYARRQGKPRWGDKTPGYVRRIRELSVLLPEAKFIHLIRDGRDVAMSWMQTPFSPGSIEETAERWRRYVGRGRKDGREIPDRYLEVRYEDLVDDPEPVLRTISDFVDLSFDPVMLDHTQRANEIIASVRNPAIHQNLQQPVSTGMRDWRQEMSPEDVHTFQVVAGDLLEELGYEVV